MSPISPILLADIAGPDTNLGLALMLVMTIVAGCLIPAATVYGQIQHGHFTWIQPLIVLCAVTIVWRYSRKARARHPILISFCCYVIATLSTNLWAVTHTVDHSGNYPITDRLIAVRVDSRPTVDFIRASFGAPISDRIFRRDDEGIPSGVAGELFARKLSEVRLLEYGETSSWLWHRRCYLMFDVASGEYFGVSVSHQKLTPETR